MGLKNNLVKAIDEVLTPMDLTAAQYGVIICVATNSASTLVDLCQLMDYDRGAMSRLINRLEKKELIQRNKCPDDARCSILTLTAKGQEFYPLLIPKVNKVYEKAMANFTPEEQQTFAQYLCRANLNLMDSDL